MDQQTPEARRRRWTWIPAIGAALLICCILALYIFLTCYDINNLKPLISTVVKEKTGRDLVIRGPIKLEIETFPSIIVQDMVLRNASWGSHPDMVLVERMKVQISLFPLLKKRVEVESVTLVKPTFLFETDRSGKSNFSFDPPKKPLIPSKTGFELSSMADIDVEKGHVSFKDGKTGQSFSLTIDRLKARRAGCGLLVALETEGRYASERFRIKGVVGTLESLIDPEKPWPIDVTAGALGMAFGVEGSLAKPLSLEGIALNIKGQGRSTGRVAEFFDLRDLPELGPFAVEGAISIKKEKLFQVSGFKLACKGFEGGGNLALNLNQKSPQLRGSLALNRVDISPFVREHGGREKRQGPGKEKKIFSAQPMPFATPGAGKFAVDVELRVVQVLLPSLRLSDLKTRLRFTGDRFMLKPLQFKAGGGDIKGALEMRAQGGKTMIISQANIKNMDLNTLVKKKNFSGILAAEIDLVTQGSSISSWMGNLSGKAFVSVSGLSFENNSVGPLSSQFLSIILQVFAPSSKEAKTTEITCLVGGFDVKKGLAEVTTLFADTHEVVVLGKGRLNLREETLDLSITPYSKKGIGGMSFSLTELTKAFKLGGTLAEPSLRIDPLRSALTIGKMLGGMILLGPAGAVVVFAGQKAGDGDLCLAAMEQAKRIDEIPGPLTQEEETSRSVERDWGVKDAIRSVGESVGRFFKNLPKQPVTPPDGYERGP